jgi:hypothetical protein
MGNGHKLVTLSFEAQLRPGDGNLAGANAEKTTVLDHGGLHLSVRAEDPRSGQ